uniref:Mlr5040 protein n=1 Tax=uncultured Thiotrichaceae bacterium TaxID=298394 RepID=A0A6S6T6Y2_9GAMM|nr:MAG: Mlr5040 protein [uncultured Thiotrichaceae bacterium]
METVSFTEMKHGTKADYEMLEQLEKPYLAGTAKRLMRELASQADESLAGYKVTRLEHSLQSATRAWRDGAEVDWVVGALLHDIGDGLAPQNHDRFAAEILRPFVREEVTWVVEHHGAFQMLYYAHHYDGWDPNERDKYADSPYYQSAVDFCERWDQNCFDPEYDSKPLEFFTEMVEKVFSRKAYDEDHLHPGEAMGLPAAEGLNHRPANSTR